MCQSLACLEFPKVYVAGGHIADSISRSCKWDSRAFEVATLLAFSNVVSGCTFTRDQGVGQLGRATESRLARFFLKKMTNILRQCPFGDSFPAGAKTLHSPTNQMAAWACAPSRHVS